MFEGIKITNVESFVAEDFESHSDVIGFYFFIVL
jgi:hypothetical protein